MSEADSAAAIQKQRDYQRNQGWWDGWSGWGRRVGEFAGADAYDEGYFDGRRAKAAPRRFTLQETQKR